MGLFSKKDKKQQEDNNDFFDKLKKDLEEQELITPKLDDFSDKKNKYSITPEEVNGEIVKEDKPTENTQSPLDSLIRKIETNNYDTENDNPSFEDIEMKKEEEEENTEKTDTSLLHKCSAYTKDDDGNDFSVDKEPIYKLKTVAEILKNDGFRALDELSKKYDIEITDETVSQKDDSKSNAEENVDTLTAIKTEEKSKEEKTDNENLIFEDYLTLSTEEKEEIEDDNAESSIFPIPDISDIDNKQKINIIVPEEIPTDKTVRFTPIKNTKDNTHTIKITNITQSIDVKENGDISSSSSPENSTLEQNDFDDFEPKEQIVSTKDIKSYIVKTAKKKRSNFISLFLSGLSTALVAFFAITPFSDMLLDGKNLFITCTVAFLLNTIVNIDMFLQFGKIFKKNCNADISSSIISIFVIITSVLQIVVKDTAYIKSAYYTILIASIILFVRILMKFRENSVILSNLKQLNSNNAKTAISLINDSSVTYSMAKDCIEGDVLLAGSRKTDFINDYTKYVEYTSLFGGKYSIYQTIVFAISIITLFGANIYYHNIVASLFCATAIQSFFALPTLFFINNLPLWYASKKLKPEGAMICGNYGAELIENANAAVLSTADIFPEGSIVLKDIKVLSNSNIDDMLLRAASLAQAVDSTLAPVFRKIVKTNTDYLIPDSDTVKYEKRLGISGYVEDELLLIGNRKFMESHGIEVPSIEVDKKILRNGFFPVYLSTINNTCALLIVEYIPSPIIAKQLRRITDAGVTLLFTNSDPNINEVMISDHFGLYEDSVHIVSNAGEHMYKNATKQTPDYSAPAMYRFKSSAFLNILNSASFIKKTNTAFSLISIISSILLTAAFVYATFASSGDFPSAVLALCLELGVTLVSLIVYFIKKP